MAIMLISAIPVWLPGVLVLITLALLASQWGSTVFPRLQWMPSSGAAVPDGMQEDGHSTAVPPEGERLFGRPLPSLSLNAATRALQPQAYRRCVAEQVSPDPRPFKGAREACTQPAEQHAVCQNKKPVPT